MAASAPTPQYVDGLAPDKWYYSLVTDNCFKVVERDVTFDADNGVCEGTVTVQTAVGEEPIQWSAEGLRNQGLPDEIVAVSEAVATDPAQILREFALEELRKYEQQLSPTHPYNGVDGVDTIAGLQAAARIHQRRRQHDS